MYVFAAWFWTPGSTVFLFISLLKVNIKSSATVYSSGFSKSKQIPVTCCEELTGYEKNRSPVYSIMLSRLYCFTINSSSGAKRKRPILKFILWNVETEIGRAENLLKTPQSIFSPQPTCSPQPDLLLSGVKPQMVNDLPIRLHFYYWD